MCRKNEATPARPLPWLRWHAPIGFGAPARVLLALLAAGKDVSDRSQELRAHAGDCVSAQRVSDQERTMSTYRPGEAASKLGVASATLRRYSVQFADKLSPSASAAVAQGGGALERRYTESDIALLQRASGMLERGLTFDQVRAQLAGSEDDSPPAAHQLTITNETGRALVELVSARGETIAAQRETIALLHSEVERLKAALERQQRTALAAIRHLQAQKK